MKPFSHRIDPLFVVLAVAVLLLICVFSAWIDVALLQWKACFVLGIGC